jgi:hypothetical protein
MRVSMEETLSVPHGQRLTLRQRRVPQSVKSAQSGVSDVLKNQ